MTHPTAASAGEGRVINDPLAKLQPAGWRLAHSGAPEPYITQHRDEAEMLECEEHHLEPMYLASQVRALLATTQAKLEEVEAERDEARRAGVRDGMEQAAKIADDDDQNFTIWGEDRNSKVAQVVVRDIAAAIRDAREPQEGGT